MQHRDFRQAEATKKMPKKWAKTTHLVNMLIKPVVFILWHSHLQSDGDIVHFCM